MNRILIGLAGALLASGCSSISPVLYPNTHYHLVGKEAAERDVEACMQLAESAGADRSGSSAGEAASNTAVGAAAGAASGAVGGAVVGAAGTGSAIGAASGATAGMLRWLFSKPDRNPAFENFVNKCLQDRGYQPMGWN